MFRKSTFSYALMLTLFFSHGVSATQTNQTRRAYTVDDMLRIEEIGSLQIRSNGQSILLEYQPAYEDRGMYGVERGGQILQLSLSGERQATQLFEHQTGNKYWLGDVSPDGRRLLVFQASHLRTRLAVFDFQTKQLTPIDHIPQVNERSEMNSPIWINNHEIIFSSQMSGWNEYGIRIRPYMADRITELWKKAFTGDSSVVSVSTKPARTRYDDGALVRYNVNTKAISVIQTGRFGGFRLSADGKKLAAVRLRQRIMRFPVDQLTDYYRFDTQLFVFELENKSSLPILPDKHVSMNSLRWSVTGSKLSFFAWDRMTTMGNGSHYVIDSGSIIQIKPDGFAPSWTKLGGYKPLKVPVAAEWLKEKLVVHGAVRTPASRHEVKGTLAVNGSENEETKWHAIEIETMSAEAIINGGNQSSQVRWLRDGRLLVQSGQGFFIASDTDNPLALNIDKSDTAKILNGRVGDEIEDTVVFTISSDEGQKLGFLDVSRNRLAAPVIEVTNEVLAWAPQNQQVITRSDTNDGGTLYFHNRTSKPTTLFTFNDHVSKIEHPRWQTIGYAGTDGVPTFSCIILPYNYDAERSYPTIVDIYPGKGKGCRSGSRIKAQPIGGAFPLQYNNDLLSANGYLVVIASNSYELNQSDGTQFGGLSTQVDAVLDALVAAGMTDPDRIGIWGFSNGSMASLWLASVSNRYKAVVPMFGGSSPHIEYFGGASPAAFEMYLGRPIVHLVQYESESGAMPLSMGKSAIKDASAYIKSSPLDRAKYICSPVMMFQSDLDGFTPYHYEAFFSAMYRLGKQAELVRYYGEGHGLQSPENIRDFYKRVLTFFDEYVATGRSIALCNGVTAK